jgi:glycosyltransferase involved in cell wall biosynthesis
VRILLDYRPALRHRTGVGEYVHALAEALQQTLTAEDTLTLFSSSWRDRLAGAPVPGAAVVDARVPVRVLNYAWHRAEWPPVERFAGELDIAHAAHPLMIPARRAAKVITIHDLDFLDYPERTRAEIRRDYPVLVARHAARADLVVTVSESVAAVVRARLHVAADRLVVCRPGAPPWAPREPPTTVGPILFVGTLEPRKNVGALVRAYERVRTRRQDAPPLLLAGPAVEQSRDLVQTASRTAGVQLLGYVHDEQRRRLYREASMLVLPSLHEGFGLPALEAMTIGLPVIASQRGALPEVVGDAGILIDPLDNDGLANAIEAVLADAPRRRAMADAGIERSRQFSWPRSAERLVRAYRDTLARRRAQASR